MDAAASTGTPPAEWFRRVAAWALWALLAGYLIFNKPFALLGWPPLYIGEIVFGIALVAALTRFRDAFLEPLRTSWTFRLVALFFVYGTARVLLDSRQHGIWAFRDGIVAGYALLAFVAPAVWRGTSTGAQRPGVLSNSAARVLLPAGVLAAAWAALVSYGFIDMSVAPWNENKPDFTTLAAAVGAWVVAASVLRVHPLRAGLTSGARAKYALLLLLGGAAALAALALMLRLPTRAVYLAVVPLPALVVAGFITRGAWQAIGGAVLGMALLAGVVLVLPKVSRASQQATAEFRLNENLNFSISELEVELRRNPETYPKFDTSLDMTNITPEARIERLQSLVSGKEEDFNTLQGRRSSHAVKWRSVFWQRAINYLMEHSPLFGIGFGVNITNVNRHSEAWNMFIPSMSLGNRNPHSAHMTVLVRMGLVGLVLWIVMLLFIALGALRAAWFHRTAAGNAELRAETREQHRASFWNTLLVTGVWVLYLISMSFGVMLENPMGGMWFWVLSGLLAREAMAGG